MILESVRGDDIYLLVDVCNYSLTYSLCGHENRMSPDDHYQDLKRTMIPKEPTGIVSRFLFSSRFPMKYTVAFHYLVVVDMFRALYRISARTFTVVTC